MRSIQFSRIPRSGLVLATLLSLAPLAASAQMGDMPGMDHMTHAEHAATSAPMAMTMKAEMPKGDAYPLATDPVSGEPLAKTEGGKPIVYDDHGTEVRFASQASLDKYKADPVPYREKIEAAIVKLEKPAYPLTECIVSGAKLGGMMGDPVDYVWRNRYVQFCCSDCPKEFAKAPAKYMKLLNDAVIAKQVASYPLTTCVVSGEKLGGAMGKPIDFVYENRLVRFCCPDCVKDFNADPATYLARIDAAAKSAK